MLVTCYTFDWVFQIGFIHAISIVVLAENKFYARFGLSINDVELE